MEEIIRVTTIVGTKAASSVDKLVEDVWPITEGVEKIDYARRLHRRSRQYRGRPEYEAPAPPRRVPAAMSL
jgi:hypothetical protein